MKRAQLHLAAELYSLATMAHLDNAGAESPDQDKVMTLAAKKARAGLRDWLTDRNEICTIQDAIDKAREPLLSHI